MDFEKTTNVFMEYVLYYNNLFPDRNSAFYNDSVPDRQDIAKCLMADPSRICTVYGIHTALSLGAEDEKNRISHTGCHTLYPD